MPKFSPNTGFKLGTRSDKSYGKTALKFKTDTTGIPGTPVYRKDLEGDILGEANKDGSIFISNKVKPGSKKEEEVLKHEMKHIVDMKIGKLHYTDDTVKWNGKIHKRKNGKIQLNGKWLPEGSKDLPWEKH